ncbi:collagen-like triple helix repeat-containing protein, partial [Burkholderia multivorans]
MHDHFAKAGAALAAIAAACMLVACGGNDISAPAGKPIGPSTSGTSGSSGSSGSSGTS